MKKSDTGPAREHFRDRSERLSLFGILSMILGAACGLLGLVHLLPSLTDSALLGDPRSLLMSALTYCIFGGILVWAGIGSLRKRRWVQPMMLIISWCWLIVGLLCLILVIVLLEDIFILSTAGIEELPPSAGIIVKSIMLAVVAFGGLLLPTLFIWVYRDGNILRTCEHYDPAPSWVDRCPKPVLALSTALGLAAILSPPLALKPIFPLFGILATGWVGSLLILASAAYFGYLARATFKLTPSAWWGTFIYLLLWGLSTALTLLRVDPLLFYRAIGYPEQLLMEMGDFGIAGRQIAIWITLLVTVASLAYMLAIRRYFEPAARGGALLLLGLLLLLSGCAAKDEPLLIPLRESADRTAVVVIPGITGIQLREAASGRIAWGRMHNLLFPRDGGYDVALPVQPDARSGRLEPFAPLLSIDLPWPGQKEVYAPLQRMMRKNGYRPGDLTKPAPEEDFFFFVYDWRLGAVEASAELLRQLEGLRLVRAEPILRITIICQSNAALIGRYFVKYGDASLEEAESGTSALSASIEVEKLILIGTANGGALRVLHEMNHGRRYIALIGRRWLPETLFTFDSLFESLPAYREEPFIDGEGEQLSVDLFDPANWEKYGWSIYGPEAARRLERLGDGGPFGDRALRKERLRRMLERTERLHRLLAADVEGIDLPSYYSLQNSYSRTPERALLERRKGRWRTWFEDDPRVIRDPFLLSLAASPGDGHATLESQNRLSPKEKAALEHPPVYIEGEHFGMINSPAAQRWLLHFLLE